MIGVPANAACQGRKMKGFKDFVMRGNLVELAVAFIMAAAFAAVVTTFTNWLLSLIPAGATNFGDTKFGLFLTALVFLGVTMKK
jgi:large conductance mechanosensitive channel